MSEKFTIARPYAQAAFDQAQQEDALPLWSEMLALAAAIAKDSTMEWILDSPVITRKQVAELFTGLMGERFAGTGHNLLRLLAINDRLAVLPEISDLFDKYKAANERLIKVTSACPIGSEQEQFLVQALERYLGHSINITIEIDEEIIGGAIVHIGDVVIDGSLRAGLTQMTEQLLH